MAGWKKYFKTASFGSNPRGVVSPINSSAMSNFGYRNYQSQLPEVYVGHPNRVERYNQYEQMDADSDINAALDIISEFSVQMNEENGTVFKLFFNETPTDNEIKIIKEQLIQWCKLNELNKRMFKIFRSVIKYGDQVFVRDPETFKLYWTEMSKVTKVIVNESDGKKPEQYVIKDMNPNLENLTVTAVTTTDIYMNHPQVGGPNGSYTPMVGQGGQGGTRFTHGKSEGIIDAKNILHISLTEGIDVFWPFGVSVLESVFKVFKQKELLEDAVIIYRIQRAPERRLFKVDVGDMPPQMAMAFVERIKNEVQQRRIPTQSGGGCFAMDTEIPLLDNRTLTIAQLATEYQQGKVNWTYSCDPITGKVVPGEISWAGVTQESALVIELTLDNNEKIICTPEHKFPVIGKGFVEAKKLKSTDQLFGFNVTSFLSKETMNPLTVISSVKKTERIQVGTLTIDEHEELHDYHTFAIKQGVFTKNSNMLDASYNPMCLDLTTRIPLLDGRTLSLSEIIQEFENGKENWVYSCNPKNGAIVPGVINWAGITRKNTETIKLIFDNGKELICTPDHKIPVFGKGFVEAKDLTVNDSLIAFHTNVENRYTTVWDHETKKWKFVHKLVADFFRKRGKHQVFTYLPENANEKKHMVHHKDLNRYNNDPKNLFFMNSKDRDLYYDVTNPNFWKNLSRLDKGQFRDELIPEAIKHWKDMSPEHRRAALYWLRVKSYGNKLGGIKFKLQQHQEFTSLDFNLLQSVADLAKNDKSKIHADTVIGKTKLDTLLKKFSYSGWDDFVNKLELFNHRIVEIQKVEPRDTGTITVDGYERWHNYHTFAIESGIFVKNSINEDFFFPQSAAGRGSSVEVLPGGSNLGEVTDLRLFTNKLFRGLRIPSSYLPTQTDEAANVHADGKTGIAMIQEFRFNAYCKRLQSQIVDAFDREFKLFMKFRGINIDNSVFDLRLNEPQNFTKYRQIEVDTARIQTFTQLEQYPYLSKRFLMKRYLDLSEEEMQENEKMWAEEHEDTKGSAPESSNLRDVGVSAGGISTDLENTAPMPDMGAEMGGGDMGGGPDMGGGAMPGGDVGGMPPG
jgi:intein/homing endonuclease